MPRIKRKKKQDKIVSIRDLSPRQLKVLGILYMAWELAKIFIYPMLVLTKAVEFHKCTKLVRGVFGGNRSSKSTTGAADLVMFALQLNFFRPKESFPKPPFLIWVVTNDFTTARDVALKKILFWLPRKSIARLSWTSNIHELELTNGVLIQFRSWMQGYDRQKGREVAYIWFDEEPEDELVFQEMEFRTIGASWRPGEIVITCTPDKGFSYVIERVYVNRTKDPEVASFEFSAYDNPYIDGGAVHRLENHTLAGNAAEIQMRIYGRPAARTGLVYSEFNPTIYDQNKNPSGSLILPFKPEPWWDHGLAIDPGADCFACSWFFVDGKRNVYLYRGISWTDIAFSSIAKEIRLISRGTTFKTRVIDGAEKAAEIELRSWGVSCNSHRLYTHNLEEASKRGEKGAGIQRVKYYLSGAIGPRLFIFSDQMDVIRQMSRYIRDKNGEPKKENDHFPDTIRYFLSTFPPPAKPPLEVDHNSLEEIEKRLLGSIEDEDEELDLDQDYAALEKDLAGRPTTVSGYSYF